MRTRLILISCILMIGVTANTSEVFKALGVGDFHTCGLAHSGKVYCWGMRNGTEPNTVNLTPTVVSGLSSVAKIAVGARHTCVLQTDGQIKCWGENRQGQLGEGTHKPSLIPVTVKGIPPATGLVAGIEHNCASFANGPIYCWGETFGGFGDGHSAESETPLPVKDIFQVENLWASENTCVRNFDKSVTCWGNNLFGQLGAVVPGVALQRYTLSGMDFVELAMGSEHACGRSSSGAVYCWGQNLYGQLGLGDNKAGHDGPQKVNLQEPAISISANQASTCAVLQSGGVACWGRNSRQLLGDKTYTNHFKPVFVNEVRDSTLVSVGMNQACALTRSGVIQCWGDNIIGQMREKTSLPELENKGDLQ